MFHGIQSEKPDIIKKHNLFIAIVTSEDAVNAAKDLFMRLGKPQSEFVYVADTFIDAI